MTATREALIAERGQALIARRLGLRCSDDGLKQLLEVLQRRTLALGLGSVEQYLDGLESESGWRREQPLLAKALTVGETYFFRYAEQFRSLADLLPALAARKGSGEPLTLLSAGSSSGEEAYSLAMLVRDLPALQGQPVRIHAFDVNPVVVAKARQGRYGAWSLRETPEAMRRRHFEPQGRDYQIGPAVRAMVTFEERNLVDADPAFWHPGSFDVIVCRNTLMYFDAAIARDVIDRMAGTLRDGGCLFLGHAETLRGLSQAFVLRQAHGTFYYQLAGAGAPEPAPGQGPAAADTAWATAIRRSSERVATLSDTLHAAKAGQPVPEWPQQDLLDLLWQGRDQEALARIAGLDAGLRHHPDVLLLKAVFLTNMGAVTEARDLCAHLLSHRQMQASVQFLLALGREHDDDPAGVKEHCLEAMHLDGSFAMPHLRYGLAAARDGERDLARRTLRQAIALLEREEPLRIHLFGGGFGRAGLIELARAGLGACGDPA